MNNLGSSRKRVLFVGAFKKSVSDGATGGVQSACNLLIESELSNLFEFKLIDTSNNTVPPPKTYQKLHHIIFRNIKSLFFLGFGRISTFICFSSSGKSVIEKGYLILIAKKMGKRTILSIRAGDIIEQYENKKWMKYFLPLVLKNCDYIICQSDFWAKFYSNINQSKKNQVLTIYNWIRISEVKISKNRNSNLVQLLYLGWIEKTKGIFDLVNAINIVVKNYNITNIHVNVCGGGSAKEEVVELVSELNISHYFTFHGWVHGKEKEIVLSTSDIFVMPTYFEGFPNSMIEAINFRLAVIINNIPAIEGYLQDGKHALLSEIGDCNSLANCVLKVVEDSNLRQELAENAFDLMVKNNSIAIAVDKFKEIL